MTERSYFCFVIHLKMSKGEETRQFIIEKAAPLFNVKGIEATAMSDIMKATKLSKGSLYVHFKNKEELVENVFLHNMKVLGKKVMNAVQRPPSAKEKLFAYIDVLIDIENPPVAGGCPMMNFGIEADDTNPMINSKVKKEIAHSLELISNIIVQGKKSGEFRADWNHDEFATLMFAMIEGGVIISRITGDNTKIDLISNKLKKMIVEQTE